MKAAIPKQKQQVIDAISKTCNLETNKVIPNRRLRSKTSVPRADNISGGRQAHTVVTSVWSDGTQGPLTIVFSDKKITQKLIEELNEEFEGEAFVMQSCFSGKLKKYTYIYLYTSCYIYTQVDSFVKL
jgi:hypothetical protein